jgi:LmbE family N-acetylglucosaminyl deacetylase
MRVLAAAAHPDDIEFMMAGTLLRLRDAGCEIHLWSLANGCCGSATLTRHEAAAVRWRETQAAAQLAGGTAHPPLFDDLAIFYDAPSLAKVAAIVRRLRPTIILTQSPQDYMEDHQNTARLMVSAAFARGMPNFTTDPDEPAADFPVAIYHALPHGLRDALRQAVEPHFFTDIAPVLTRKRAMLACHASQKEWLDRSQGMNAYLNEMEHMSREVGRMSGRCEFAEGWRRHSHLGFAAGDFDPLSQLLEYH